MSICWYESFCGGDSASLHLRTLCYTDSIAHASRGSCNAVAVECHFRIQACTMSIWWYDSPSSGADAPAHLGIQDCRPHIENVELLL